MTAAVGGSIGEAFVVDGQHLSDSELERLENLAFKALLSNRISGELKTLFQDFAAYGSEGIEDVVVHFNDRLARFWSPYKLVAERQDSSSAITIKLMRAERGQVLPTGPAFQVTLTA